MSRTSLMPCMKGSELEFSALAEGGVGGTLSRIPTVARKQTTMAGIAYIMSCNSNTVCQYMEHTARHTRSH